MRPLSHILRDVDAGAEIVAEIERFSADLKAIEQRLAQDGLDRPDEHAPLADADREGRQFLARGSAVSVPIVFTSDFLVQTFAPKSAVHERIAAALDGEESRLLAFYTPSTRYAIAAKDGKTFRARAEEMLGAGAPKLIAAARAVDKDGVPKSAIKIEWKAAKENE